MSGRFGRLLASSIVLTLWGAAGSGASPSDLEPSAVERRYYEAWGLTPDDPEAYARYAARMGESLKFGEAAAFYREALRLRPDYHAAHFHLAMLLVAQDEPDQALPHFQAVVGSGIEYEPVAHSFLGRIYGRRGRGEEAIAHFRKAVELNPDQPSTHFNLGLTLKRHQRSDEAIEQFEEVLRLTPDSHLAHSNIGEILVGMGRSEEAIPHFEAMLRIDQHDPSAHYQLGLIREIQGNTRDATVHYRRALALAQERGDRELAERIRKRLPRH